MKNIIRACIVLIIINACKKEYVKNPPPYQLRVLTDQSIIAEINGIETNFNYTDISPDTLGSYYLSASASFYLARHTTNGHNPNIDQKWSIIGNKINIDQINYPITFWPKPRNYFMIHPNSSGVNIFHSIPNDGFSINDFDTSLFSITLQGFNHDTLSGVFQGDLYATTYQTDSIEHITNGRFKIFVNRR